MHGRDAVPYIVGGVFRACSAAVFVVAGQHTRSTADKNNRIVVSSPRMFMMVDIDRNKGCVCAGAYGWTTVSRDSTCVYKEDVVQRE